MTPDSKSLVVDSAKNILTEMPLSNEDRSNLWDVYHAAPDADTLAKALADVPPHISEPLVRAKRQSAPTILPASAPTVLTALEHLGKIDSAVLDLAEKNPLTLKTIIDVIRAGAEEK